jgi:hypothetical protein
MNKYNFFKKILIIAISVCFISTSFAMSIGGNLEENNKVSNSFSYYYGSQKDVTVSCQTFGFPRESCKKISMSYSEAESLYNKIKELEEINAKDPFSDKTIEVQNEIIKLVEEYGLISKNIYSNTLLTSLNPSFISKNHRFRSLPLTSRGLEFFCSFIATGSGSALPIIALPRFVPILMTPIPRMFMFWNANTVEAVTSCGGLFSGTGFIAIGPQSGLALGFWGIGFTFSLPPLMGVYGLIGYAMVSRVKSEYIEFYPPNSHPIISSEYPLHGDLDIPVTQSELSFKIEDPDNDRMSYSVTTDPPIGSENGNNKKNGFYSVPINGLEHDKTYRWTVEVSDGMDTTIKQFGFGTAEKPPFDPFNEGWKYRKKITIDHTNVDGDLSDFPVLVSITDIDLKNKVQNDGDDILFMDDTGVSHKIYHEIEDFDSSSGELTAWVNIPYIESTVDTNFYLYYGNSICSSQQYPEKVWDSNYKAVYHMNENQGILKDSTINYNNCNSISGTPNYQRSGKIGYAIDFEESNDDHFNDGDILDDLEEITVECWLNLESVPMTHNAAMVTHEDAWYFAVRGMQSSEEMQGKFQWAIHGDGGSLFSIDEALLGSWEYVVSTFVDASDEIKLYRDGILNCQKSWGGHMPNAYASFAVGDQRGNDHHFDGLLDEIRVSTIARSPQWIATTYNNQNNPSGFMSLGPEETGP